MDVSRLRRRQDAIRDLLIDGCGVTFQGISVQPDDEDFVVETAGHRVYYSTAERAVNAFADSVAAVHGD